MSQHVNKYLYPVAEIVYRHKNIDHNNELKEKPRGANALLFPFLEIKSNFISKQFFLKQRIRSSAVNNSFP